MKKFAPMPTGCGSPPIQRERVLTVRVTFDHFDQLKRAARERNVTVSELVREHLPDKK